MVKLITMLAAFYLLHLCYVSSVLDFDLKKNVSSVLDFDQYQLVLQWPKTTCTVNNYRKISHTVKYPMRFGIHGLWPHSTKGGPMKAYNFTFPSNKKKLYKEWPKRMQEELDDNWPDVVRGDNYTFWSHEWYQHGKYSGNNSVEYFFTTNNLYKRFKVASLVNALKTAKKPVVVGGSYDVATLTSAFKETLGGGKHDIQIKCASSNGTSQIWELYVYLDSSPNLVEVPPPTVSDNCQGNVTFPSPT